MAPVPAIVTAGDRSAARAVHGQSKVYLEVGGLSLVARAVDALQRVPEVSEVWVVGDPERLPGALAPVAADLRKPVHVVPQFRNLYENCWETYRRLLPGAGPAGRDPADAADLDQRILYLSADLPFVSAEEVSLFLREALAIDTDYVLGLSTEKSMELFYPVESAAPGIRMAYFNLREGRFRQNNLHLVRPGRLEHRFYIEEMYEHRYQKQFGAIAGLAWRLLRSHGGGLATLGYYLLLQAASIADRNGWRRVADGVRRLIPVTRIERGLSQLLGCTFRFHAVELGGCAVDIDNEEDFDAACLRFEEWSKEQRARAEATAGPLALPAPREDAGIRLVPEERGG